MYEEYKELVRLLKDKAEKFDYDGWVDTAVVMEKAADAIEELQGQIDGWIEQERKAQIKSLPRWIPVTERLPEKRKWVLVCSKFVKMKTDFISNDGKWHTTPGVTHWTPLPEPPKEESDG